MFLSAGKQKKTIMKSNQNTKWDNTFKQKAILKHKYIAVIYSMCVAFRPIIKQKKTRRSSKKIIHMLLKQSMQKMVMKQMAMTAKKIQVGK